MNKNSKEPSEIFNKHEVQNVVEHLQFAINYVENRINRMNHDAELIIAIEIGFLGLFSYFFLKEIINTPFGLNDVIAIIYLTLTLATIFFLILTIRPPKDYKLKGLFLDPDCFYKGNLVNIDTKKNNTSILLPPKVIWPSMLEEPIDTVLYQKIENLSQISIKEDLKNALYHIHRLIYKKYKTYRFAILFLKWQMAFILVYIIVFFIQKALN